MNLLNIFQISKKANQIVRHHFSRIFNIYLIIEIILLFIRSLPNGVLVLLLGVVSVTLTHAYIVTSLKLIDHQEKEIHLKDAFVGIRSFARLFPAYIMRKVSLNVISFLLVVPTILFLASQSGISVGDFLSWVRLIVVDGLENLTYMLNNSLLTDSWQTMISMMVSSIISAIFSYGLAMIPYLIERYDVSWNEAMMKSWKMMKGHKRDLLFMQLIYIPRYLVYLFIINLVSILIPLSSIFGLALQLVLAIYLPITLWVPHLQVATALFYDELIHQSNSQDSRIFEL